MDHLFTAEDLAFRDAIRARLAEILPSHLKRETRTHLHMTRDTMAEWNAILAAEGWSAHHWPREAGGTGWTPIRRFLFEAELARAEAPPLSVFGVYLVGPTLNAFGSDAQKARYLPGILTGDEFWCQGYSEPEAGSDLARLKTTAKRTDTGWVVNGQKAWTTEGQFADYMILLARTNPEVKPQAGLSLFVVPMDAPGITVHPVISIDGAHSVNTVFLDDVEIPAGALIGEVDKGWTYAKFLLEHERTNNAQIHKSRAEFEKLKRHALTDGALPARYDERFALIETDMQAIEATVLRVLADETDGRDPGTKASVLKIMGSELQQAISELAMELLGEEAVAASMQCTPRDAQGYAGHWTEKHLFRRVVTIYAGSNEIQKSILAKAIFQ